MGFHGAGANEALEAREAPILAPVSISGVSSRLKPEVNEIREKDPV